MATTSSSSISSRPHLLLLLLLLLLVAAGAGAGVVAPSYSAHCESIVPESSPTSLFFDPSAFTLSNGYFSGGQPHLSSSQSTRSFYLRPRSLHRTSTAGVLSLAASLSLRNRRFPFERNISKTYSKSLLHRVGPSRFGPVKGFLRRSIVFELSGFWSESSGLLCMVGDGFYRSTEGKSFHLSAVLQLRFPKESNISTSIVTGKIESLDAADSPNHFDPISIFSYAQKNYSYTKISDAKNSCLRVSSTTQVESLALENSAVCSHLYNYLPGRFSLGYGGDCSDGNCGPFAKNLGFYPSFMSLNQIQCSGDGNLHMFLAFSNYSGYGFRSLFVPENSLVAEGFWDHEKNQLCMVACHVVDVHGLEVGSSVGDCSLGLSLWFPAELSIESRSDILGQLWSNKGEKDSGFFHMVKFRSLQSHYDSTQGLKYRYTKLGNLSKSCVAANSAKSGEKMYPDGKSINDMRFDISLVDSEGNRAWGYATPLAVDDKFYGESSYSYIFTNETTSIATPSALPSLANLNHSLSNVSYKISYSVPNTSYDGGEQTELSAEGIYNAATGRLCMVGCRYVATSSGEKQVKRLESTDCEIMISIQLSPLNPDAGEHLNGTIRSTRKKTDPLYFEPLETLSYAMYRAEAVESVWRMDIEITLVLLSLTLYCVFIGFQLFYIKKYPEVIPSISVTMLAILTMGHMIPLVLNFEAMFFMNRNRQNVLLWSGGWLEVNEVIVRVMTMVAFLLQFRFLQVAWSARHGAEGKMGLWVAERKSLQICLPLYFVGGLIAWFVHSKASGDHPRKLNYYYVNNHHSLWEDLISYAGLILDGFLLPQILFNLFWNSKDKALSPVFYVGTTLVRSLPHLYDAYRAHYYLPHSNSSYIYASPDGDFYSSAWDIIIPCEGLLFAFLIFLQQRNGGRCILPAKFRRHVGYETVPTISM